MIDNNKKVGNRFLTSISKIPNVMIANVRITESSVD